MVLFFILVYFLILVALTVVAKRKTLSQREFFFASSRVGGFIGFLSFAATLFSTFTLMGIPDFFRIHGVGTWIFLGVTDIAMTYLLLVYGLHLRSRYTQEYRGIASFIRSCYESSLAGWVYLIASFIFLIPYAAIQVQGISRFLTSFDGNFLPFWAWSAIIMLAMYLYSSLGGIKAVLYSDVVQGIVLLTVVVLVAFVCIRSSDGWHAMFARVQAADPELLSVPGPKGLFSIQFLLVSFLTILVMPITNPQLNTRIMMMKSNAGVKTMAVSVCIFGLIVIASTIPIGLYGAIHYPDLSAGEFLYRTLIVDTPPLLSGLVVIALLSAAMSTVDSQLFALDTEIRFYVRASKKLRIGLSVFALATFLLSIFNNNGIVALARLSFAGSALLAPMILFNRAKSKLLVISTIVAIAVFLLNVAGIFPPTIVMLRTDLFLFLALFLIGITTWLAHVYTKIRHHSG